MDNIHYEEGNFLCKQLLTFNYSFFDEIVDSNGVIRVLQGNLIFFHSIETSLLYTFRLSCFISSCLIKRWIERCFLCLHRHCFVNQLLVYKFFLTISLLTWFYLFYCMFYTILSLFYVNLNNKIQKIYNKLKQNIWIWLCFAISQIWWDI